MAEKSQALRANCRRYIDALEAAGATAPLVIESLRRLIRQNSSTAETARRLWHDNQKLMATIQKQMASIHDLRKELDTHRKGWSTR